jgi:sugar phosphate isomerase/epimerase
MDLGVFTILFNDLPFEDTLAYLTERGIHTVEIGTGGYSRSNHLDVDLLLSSENELYRFRELLKKYNVAISGLGAQGNPVHPKKEIAARYRSDFEKTVLVAEKLGVDTVLLLSGCPGGSGKDETPNWITCPWPEDYSRAIEYQWEEVLIPYWNTAAEFANNHGIKKLAIEPHPGFCVYNTETALKLRKRTGDTIGVNFDPSHLFWQGIDPLKAIHALGSCIYHVHAKDCYVNTAVSTLNGILDSKPYSQFSARSWNFRSVGYGQPEPVWKNIFSALAEEGFNGTVSIEHEDSLMTRQEGLDKAIELLQKILIKDKVQTQWWELRPEG